MAGSTQTVAKKVPNTKAPPAKVAKTGSKPVSKPEKKERKVVNAVPLSLVKLVHEVLKGSDDLKDEVRNITQKDLKSICETFVKTMIEQVKSGETVTFTKHLTLKRVLRAERTHVNPTDRSQEFQKPAHYIISMDVKPSLKKQFEEIDIVEDEQPKPKKTSKKTTKIVEEEVEDEEVEEVEDEEVEDEEVEEEEEEVVKPKGKGKK